jgi:hypothetical protein
MYFVTNYLSTIPLPTFFLPKREVKLIHKNNWKTLVALSLLCSFTTKYCCCRYNLIYISMVLAGAGFLLPYNSLISAVDFYKVKRSKQLLK